MNKVKKSIVLTFTLPITLLFLCGCQSHITLFDGKNLDNWERTDFAGKGEVRIDENGSMVLEMGAELSGVHWKGETELPKINYEVTLQAKRTMGSDFFCGLTFPFKESHATLILGGWGGSLIGISSLDDFDASENDTGDAYVFEDKKWYDVRLRVTEEKLQVWLDSKMVIDSDVEGRKVSMRFGEIEMSVPFGICTYATTGVIRDISIKKLK
ncbi:MAG: hypothetical protein CMI29_08570 [Opitutae bacterium]|mgnify:CR=1 FL=1|nr:hypothetical protein [Opitutae bacterium]|tara:strand:- start:8598 stop:9233 length:636 start_codon:yes stop_codon:yes gene_type:complete